MTIAGALSDEDAGGNLLALDNGRSSPGWWNVLQDVVFVTLGLSWLLALAGQVASYRRSSGERRQQLKWLLGGFARPWNLRKSRCGPRHATDQLGPPGSS